MLSEATLSVLVTDTEFIIHWLSIDHVVEQTEFLLELVLLIYTPVPDDWLVMLIAKFMFNFFHFGNKY